MPAEQGKWWLTCKRPDCREVLGQFGVPRWSEGRVLPGAYERRDNATPTLAIARVVRSVRGRGEPDVAYPAARSLAASRRARVAQAIKPAASRSTKAA